MRIVHINLFDQYGGAARVANQLIDFSRGQGHTVHQFVFQHTKKDDPYTIPIRPLPTKLMALFTARQQQGAMADYFMPYVMSIIYHPVFRQADVVHLHCINGGYFSFLLLPFLARKKLIWTLHDTMAYTAHCLYPHLCDQWQTDYCADCPQDKEAKVKQNRVLMQQIKESIINITPVQLVAPSVWLKQMVEKSIFKAKETKLIYNGIDTAIYHPRDKDAMRKKFDLPRNKFSIMFAAHGGLASEMKGGKHMINVLKQLQKKHPDLVFLHVGSAEDKVPDGIKLKTYTYPYIEDENKMAELYSAVDLFISTSLTESFGLTVCEAMACGTPVAAFAVGGLKEIIEEGKSGWLVPLKDEKAMVKAIEQAIGDKPAKQISIGENAAKRVQEHFNMAHSCEEYHKLYIEVSNLDNLLKKVE